MSNSSKKREDFTWLLAYLSPEDFMEIKIVEGIPTEMKSKKINCLSLVSEFIYGKEGDFSEILLLGQNGEKLARVGEIHCPATKTARWRRASKPYVVFNSEETVHQAIIRTMIEKKEWIWYVLDKHAKTLYI